MAGMGIYQPVISVVYYKNNLSVMLLEKKTTKQHYTINVNDCKVQGSTFLSSSVIDEDE
jgi:hypothetical protein